MQHRRRLHKISAYRAGVQIDNAFVARALVKHILWVCCISLVQSNFRNSKGHLQVLEVLGEYSRLNSPGQHNVLHVRYPVESRDFGDRN